MTVRGSFSLAFQLLMTGRLRTPQQVMKAFRDDEGAIAPRIGDIPPDDPTWNVPARLRVQQSFFTSEAHLKQHGRTDWAHVDERLTFWAFRLVSEARKRGIPLYVQCALRGEAEQTRLLRQGRTRAPYPRSAHNIGEAVDIVHGVFHWDMSKAEWLFIHELGRRVLDRVNAGVRKERQLQLTWGGTFSGLYDPAHWEITDFRARRRVLPAVEPVRYMPVGYLKNHHGIR